MHGHYGHETVTIQNLNVVLVDPVNNLILISGAIPGPEGSLVTIKTSVKNPNKVEEYNLLTVENKKMIEEANKLLENKEALEQANNLAEEKVELAEEKHEEQNERKAAELLKEKHELEEKKEGVEIEDGVDVEEVEEQA
jgi:large subunit ribosomal protein L3